MTKPFLGTGNVVSLFNFTRPGMAYFRRNRLKNVMLKIIQKAWYSTKGAVERYIDYYWPRDTSAMIARAKVWLGRFAVYDINKVPNLLIGSDVDYAAWVFSMAERMQRRGKSVKWTNRRTKQIEDDILGETVDFAKKVFAIQIQKFLDFYNLGWLFGRGRMPKHPEIHLPETTPGRKPQVRKLPRYRGKFKIIKRG